MNFQVHIWNRFSWYYIGKKATYIVLVQSQLMHGSQLWNPYSIKDITILERIQRRATKFILNDYVSDYKSCLLELNLDLLSVMVSYFVKHCMNPKRISISSTLSNLAVTTLDHQLINYNMFIFLTTFCITFISLVYLDYGITFYPLILTSHYQLLNVQLIYS